MLRELASRTNDGYTVSLWWENLGLEDVTVLAVEKAGVEPAVRQVDPESCWHAYLHAGAFIPEAYAAPAAAAA